MSHSGLTAATLQVMVPMLKGDSTQKWRAAFKQSGFMQLHGSEGECPGGWPTAGSRVQQAACPALHVSTGSLRSYLPQKYGNSVCLPAGFVMPRDRPWYVILPGSHRILWWDALVRWLAVFFFIQIPMDIAFRGQQRLARWYYISVQVNAV